MSSFSKEILFEYTPCDPLNGFEFEAFVKNYRADGLVLSYENNGFNTIVYGDGSEEKIVEFLNRAGAEVRKIFLRERRINYG